MAFFSHVEVPILSSVYVVDSRLPEVGADYTSLQASRRHVWTQQEKHVLYLLSHAYHNPTHELWRIFNGYFSQEYRRRARPRRCAWEAMRSYVKHPRRYRRWWTPREALATKADLIRTAASIGLRLRPRIPGMLPTPRPRRNRTLSSPASSTSANSELEWGSDSQQLLHTGLSRRGKEPTTPQSSNPPGGLLTPPASQSKGFRTPKTTQTPKAKSVIPPVAFRG